MSGPSSPSKIAVKFNADGSTVSGADLELVGSGYRLSLVKKRYTAGELVCIRLTVNLNSMFFQVFYLLSVIIFFFGSFYPSNSAY